MAIIIKETPEGEFHWIALGHDGDMIAHGGDFHESRSAALSDAADYFQHMEA